MSENFCMVCNSQTNHCPPSPFRPYSGWRCKECCVAHRIPYEDLVEILDSDYSGQEANCYEESLQLFRLWWSQNGLYKDDGIEYAEKYFIPTLKFFNKTTQEAWKDVEIRRQVESEKTIVPGFTRLDSHGIINND
jgi:hypothetical protein